jgi:hypothetical protein
MPLIHTQTFEPVGKFEILNTASLWISSLHWCIEKLFNLWTTVFVIQLACRPAHLLAWCLDCPSGSLITTAGGSLDDCCKMEGARALRSPDGGGAARPRCLNEPHDQHPPHRTTCHLNPIPTLHLSQPTAPHLSSRTHTPAPGKWETQLLLVSESILCNIGMSWICDVPNNWHSLCFGLNHLNKST